jgi:hypothetical protein
MKKTQKLQTTQAKKKTPQNKRLHYAAKYATS